MKKSRLPRVPLFSIISFLLLIAVIVFWARSRRHVEAVRFCTPSGLYQGLGTDPQGLLLCFTNVPGGPELGLTSEAGTMPADEYQQTVHDCLFDPANITHHLIGFTSAHGTFGPAGWNFSAVIIPYWALLIAFAVLPMRIFPRVYTRWSRKRNGRCLACGYDLRHSPGRCPECGEPSPGSGEEPINAQAKASRARAIAGVVPWVLTGIALAAGINSFLRGRRAVEHPPELAALERPINNLTLRGETLSESLLKLHSAAGVAVRVAPSFAADHTFASLGDIRFMHMTVEQALRTIMCEACRGSLDNGQVWCDPDGSIVFGYAIKSPLTVRIYPIRDLLEKFELPVPVPQISMQERPNNALFVGATPRLTMEELLNDMDSVDPWYDNSSPTPGLAIVAGNLILDQTQEGHAAMRKFLANLRCDDPEGRSPDDEPAKLDHPVKLALKIPKLNLGATTLEYAVDQLRILTGTNLIVDWDDLAAQGITKNSPLKLELRDSTLGQVLDVMRSAIGSESMSYQLDGNILRIATPFKLANTFTLITRVYNVRDIIDDAAAFRRLHVLMAKADSTSNPPNQALPAPVSVADEAEIVVWLIEHQIAPESWKDNGGILGASREMAGRMIITQTPENHREIVELLREIRSGGAQEGTKLPLDH